MAFFALLEVLSVSAPDMESRGLSRRLVYGSVAHDIADQVCVCSGLALIPRVSQSGPIFPSPVRLKSC